MTPLVSIITPAYNRRHTILEAIRSVQAQTVTDFELIVIDDGSTDGTCEAVEHIARSDTRVRLIQAQHQGRSAARNTGIDAARGEWLMLLDSDDLLLPHALEQLVACAESSEHGAAYGSWRNIDQDGHTLDDPSSDPRSTKAIGLDQLLDGTGFVIHAQLIRRELVVNVRFSTELAQSEDRDFWLRLAERGVVWSPTPVCVCEYRIMPRKLELEMFHDNFNVLTRAFERVRECNWGDRGVDVSTTREATLVANCAYEFAHRTLLDGEPTTTDNAAAAVRIVEQRYGLQAVQLIPERAAVQALNLLPFSECRAKHAWESNLERYWPAIARWWSRCVDEGWASQGFVPEARKKLLELLVSARDDMPSRVLNRCPITRRIVLLGFGRNGVRLAQELVRRGIPIVVRDDLLSQERASERFPHAPVTLLTNGESYRTDDVHVMTLLYDGEYRTKLPQGLDLVRWRDGFGEIAQELRVRMNNIWPRPHIIARTDRMKASPV